MLYYPYREQKGGGVMTPEQIKAVATVAETGSISQAAERLFVTQQSLSAAIIHLEQALGITVRALKLALGELEASLGWTLFTGGSKSLRLTDNGHLFLSRAEQLLRDYGRLKAIVPGEDHFSRQHYPASRVYGNLSCVDTVLGRAINELYARYPGFPLQLVEQGHEAIFAALADEPQSLGVLTIALDHFDQSFRRAYSSRLHWQVIVLDEIMTLAPAQSPLARRQAVTLGEFMQAPLALNDHFDFSWMSAYGVETGKATVSLTSSNQRLI